jgi:Zc3h12a-like Ribonuclease NYN domain
LAEPHHVVVDGSNLATEGRTLPSLAQLDEAVRAYAEEDPNSRITVVVDASFEHRIDEDERETLREAMLNGEVVSPPAGAIGRGDAFVLRIAERTGAIVLSNDSFQEFHGEHPWLFEDGRLIGGKPVPGVGWIFTPRLPIRGPKSRAATAEKRRSDPDSAPVKAAELARAAKKASKRPSRKAAPAVEVSTTWPITPTTPPPAPPVRRPTVEVDPDLSIAIDEAVAEALDPPTDVVPATKVAKAGKAPTKKKAAAAKKAATTKKATAAEKAAGVLEKAPATKKAAAKKATTKKAAPAKKTATKKAAAAKKSAPEMKAEPVKKSTTKKAAAAAVAAPPAPAPVTHVAHADQQGSKRRSVSPPPAVNEPLSFITFVATYPVGTMVEGEVVSFTSHGAMVDVDLPDGGSLHCYIPLTGMGDPPPIKARQMLTKGEVRPFVLSSLDPPRRVAELSLPAPPPKKRRSPAKKAAKATA